MQLTVKTLKGGKFTIEVEPSNTVAEAKAVIVSTHPLKYYEFAIIFRFLFHVLLFIFEFCELILN